MNTIADVLEGRARYCVVEADCLDVMREMPDRCVDHVITDPPYEAEAHTLNRRLRVDGGKKWQRRGVDGGKKWQRRGGETRQKPLDFAPISPELRAGSGAAIARLTRGWALVFCQFEGALLWREALKPLVYKRPCIWVKPDAMPCFIGDRPGMGYEVFVTAHTKGRSKWNGGGRVGVFTYTRDHGGGAGIRQEHPTTKPIALMSELVELFSFTGNVVLDPFAGSGTTGVAALRLGRRCILIEKDPKYAALCRERLAAEEAGSTLHARRAGQEVLCR